MTPDESKKEICQKVIEEMDFSKELSDDELLKLIDTVITDYCRKSELALSERIILRRECFNSLRRLDVIQEYLDDDSITEIMINGKDSIFVEKDGRLEKVSKRFESKEKLEDVIQQIVASCNRSVNEAYPIQDARLKTGERVNIVLDPVALNGPIVTIRRFPKEPITMDKLIAIGSITEEAADFLKRLVVSKYNIFISGGTGSGKTTFLNALSQFIPGDERIITIEDSAELQIRRVENLVRLEARTSNSKDSEPIEIKDLIKTSLRMRPERIIIGEVRGKEAIDMLAAMNTGHDGSLSTGHGNSAEDMILRIETMVLSGMEIPLPAVRNQIASAIDIFVHLGRLRDKRRVVLEISEVLGVKDQKVELNKLYEWKDGNLEKTGELRKRRKLNAWGITDEL